MRILIFIGLKLAGIGAVVFVPYWVGRLIYKIDAISSEAWGMPFWCLGGYFLMMAFGIGIFLFPLIYAMVKR